MIPPIYKQTRSWDCSNYSFLIALQKLWVNVDESYMLKDRDITYQAVESDLVADNKIKWLVKLATPTLVDLWLKKWHYILTWTSLLSFDSVRKPPYLQSFVWTWAHYFCIIDNLWDKWKVQDSQSINFADKWCWYIDKKDFKKLKACWRIETIQN